VGLGGGWLPFAIDERAKHPSKSGVRKSLNGLVTERAVILGFILVFIFGVELFVDRNPGPRRNYEPA
jgi:hypothetical protein